MKNSTFAVLFFLGQWLVAFVNAGKGADFSVTTSVEELKCLQLDFAVFRAWHSYGAFDSTCVSNVNNAYIAGIPTVDVYMFPCFKCGDPMGQADKLLSGLTSNKVDFGRIWLDIEGGSSYWGSVSANRQFFDTLSETLTSRGINVGVYTSKSQWEPIMGDWMGGALFPLWYAHYDDAANFDDFQPFSGWMTPTIKQYSQSGDSCGIGYDKDWSPTYSKIIE